MSLIIVFMTKKIHDYNCTTQQVDIRKLNLLPVYPRNSQEFIAPIRHIDMGLLPVKRDRRISYTPISTVDGY
jgi:hypothetical protein